MRDVSPSDHSPESRSAPSSTGAALQPEASIPRLHTAAKRPRAAAERQVGAKKPIVESSLHEFMAAVSRDGQRPGPAGGAGDSGHREPAAVPIRPAASQDDGGSSDSEDYAALRLAAQQRLGKAGKRNGESETSSKGGFEVVPAAAEPSSPVGDFSSFF